MEYFVSHIGPVIVVALVVAALGVIWGFAAARNAKTRDPEMQKKQDAACENCALANMCSHFGREEEDCATDAKQNA